MQNREEIIKAKREKLAARPTESQKVAAKKLAKKNAKLVADAAQRHRSSDKGG